MSETIEARLTKLERELAILKAEREIPSDRSRWIEKITGSFAGDADFKEILRLGKEMRDAEQPDYPGDEDEDT